MNPDIEARKTSLKSLTDMMTEDEIKSVPGFTITIKPDAPQGQPQQPADMGGSGMAEEDPFEALIRRKQMGE